MHPAATSRRDAWVERCVLAGIVAGALAIRLYGIDWDENHLLHPDERQILLVTDAMRVRASQPFGSLLATSSPLDPGFFAYGSLTFYLLRLATDVANWATALLPGLSDWADLTELNQLRLAGRALSAVADTATVVLTCVLGRSLAGRAVGLLASALVAGTLIHVQLSHFYTADTLLVPFCLASLLLLIRVGRGGSLWWPAIAGVTIGLALAVKLSSGPLLVPAVVALSLRPTDTGRGRDAAAIALGAAVVIAFIAAQPFSVLDWPTFVRDVATQAAIVSGRRDAVFTRQFAERPVWLYQAWNLALFGLGLPLAAAASLGLASALRRVVARRTNAEIVVFAWIVVYGVVTTLSYAKFLRYTLPMVPVLCVYAAALLVSLYHRADLGTAPAPRNRARVPVAGLLAVSLLATTWGYSLAHLAIYSRPHTAIAASRWIYSTIPPGSTIAIEHWDEPLPLPLDDDGFFVSAQTKPYTVVTMPLYDDDGDGKLRQASEELARAAWVAIYSNRLYGTIARLPQRYPMTAAYYRLLFGERLGFTLVYVSRSYPEMLGVTLADDTLGESGLPVPGLLADMPRPGLWVNLGHADESYSVYDHPMVLVFRKDRTLSADEIRAAILDEANKLLSGGP